MRCQPLPKSQTGKRSIISCETPVEPLSCGLSVENFVHSSSLELRIVARRDSSCTAVSSSTRYSHEPLQRVPSHNCSYCLHREALPKHVLISSRIALVSSEFISFAFLKWNARYCGHYLWRCPNPPRKWQKVTIESAHITANIAISRKARPRKSNFGPSDPSPLSHAEAIGPK